MSVQIYWPHLDSFDKCQGKLDTPSGFSSMILSRMFSTCEALKTFQRNVETLVEQI